MASRRENLKRVLLEEFSDNSHTDGAACSDHNGRTKGYYNSSDFPALESELHNIRGYSLTADLKIRLLLNPM